MGSTGQSGCIRSLSFGKNRADSHNPKDLKEVLQKGGEAFFSHPFGELFRYLGVGQNLVLSESVLVRVRSGRVEVYNGALFPG